MSNAAKRKADGQRLRTTAQGGKAYQDGYDDQRSGAGYKPPKNALLRECYDTGYNFRGSDSAE